MVAVAARVRVAIMMGLLALLSIVAVTAPLGRDEGLTILLFLKQDLIVLPLLLAAVVMRPRFAGGVDRSEPPRLVVPLICLLLFAAALAGRYFIFSDIDFTRDEQMASFDAFVFSHGRLSWPLAADWRPLAPTLNTTFMLPIAGNAAWVSSYLPMNAAIRALVGEIADPVLTGPLLLAIGAVALWSVTGKLLPDAPRARIVTLILYALSAQALAAAMTSYAMTAHLALDLVWLALFLRGGWRNHAGAIMVGAVATGLHQPLFHPLFVLPFLWLLLRERRWRTLTAYCVAYAAIGSFWLAWPTWMSVHAAPRAAHTGVAAGAFVAQYLHGFDIVRTASLMALNLIRFATWQHLLLLPLAGLGVAACWREQPMVRALAVGVVLPAAAAAVLLPYQGHGWGYRYMHGVIGNACLLGGYGWRWAAGRGAVPARAFLWSSAATTLILLPLRGYQAATMVAPSAGVEHRIRASGADLVLVDDKAAPFAADLVINRPDLASPVRLAASALAPGQLATLCRRRPTLLVIDATALRAIGAFYGAAARPTAGIVPLVAEASHAGCRLL